jgi:hypothetical protein
VFTFKESSEPAKLNLGELVTNIDGKILRKSTIKSQITNQRVSTSGGKIKKNNIQKSQTEASE